MHRYLLRICIALVLVLSLQSIAQSALPAGAGEFLTGREATWQREYEVYFQNQFTSRRLNPSAIQRILRQMSKRTGWHTALLHLAPTANEIKLLVTSLQGEPLLLTVPAVSQADLMATVQDFRRSVADPRQQFLSASFGSSEQLLEKYGVALIPAFNLIKTDYAPLKNATVLAMGASEFDRLSPLPAVPQELSAIQQLWGGSTFLNRDFTVANLTQQRQQGNYSIVHLATHALFRPGQAQESFIQLWGSETVTLQNLPQLNLEQPPLELLVLSTCQTALGDDRAELGSAGLALQSGAKSAVASLWQVSDAGTLELMEHFYSHLHHTASKVAALQKAQLHLLRYSRFQAPYFWAGFTLVDAPW
ncbi:CHAT domain-containing protein [Thermosynechococcus sp. JY1334]|uniref:CHAT domain-containing protein n=1 Tax=unclassified Thermosynechococcus TaxID=2622553 RepID=UPI002672B62C|nr:MULTISPECIES: CHAT domain-containing protein [unclassified Thermosynechococcus]MDR7898484.1 CHAT domain-containing protein [Thermosynechococcus sp. JY1332]MDR7905886.1 CHAT domain-containing protein [Thermosynechococcus sp. JY1334]MDR7993707.1 CHAT domain-containing protein [Thermosynechococcus sp. TG252]WKT85622.1 CHAT domain-containing protein [Thermosynechococcus sp. JY1339]WNC54566.1 CHAT domain-containing protein [Thermosynechococcus sp. JY1331]